MDNKTHKSFCTAPWVHSHVATNAQRRLCCVSREAWMPAANLQTMQDYWNGPYLKEVRRKMLVGEKVEACVICDHDSYKANPIRSYYNSVFETKIPEILEKTKTDGETKLLPISFDHRVNQCNFKCRMCGPQSSTSWAQESGWDVEYAELSKKNKEQLKMADEEIYQAVEEKRLTEIYWAGGEPLIMKRHWDIMAQLIEKGYADQVMVRYNSNLSHIVWQGKNIVDLIRPFKGVQFHASIDGPGRVGEFIRTGLDWQRWQSNIQFLKNSQLTNLYLDLDFTMTLPGLIHLDEMMEFANQLGVKLRGKMIIPTIRSCLLSPLSLPRSILHELIEDVENRIQPHLNDQTKHILHLIEYLKGAQTYEEKYPEWKKGLDISYKEQKRIADLRRDGKDGRISIEEIYAKSPPVLSWWSGLNS